MGAPPAPPMGMADGGLAALPLPESMFGEPMDSGYADGGIVAFAQGDEVYGYSADPMQNLAEYRALYQPQQKYGNRLTES
jgi:hypothetical protein